MGGPRKIGRRVTGNVQLAEENVRKILVPTDQVDQLTWKEEEGLRLQDSGKLEIASTNCWILSNWPLQDSSPPSSLFGTRSSLVMTTLRRLGGWVCGRGEI